MNKLMHVFYTWALTIQFAFNSVILYEIIKNPWNNIAGYFSPQMCRVVLLGYVSALPSLFFSIVFITYLLRMRGYSLGISFFLWYLAVCIAAFLNILVLALLFGMGHAILDIIRELWFVFPAAIIAVTIRYRFFFSLAMSHDEIGCGYSDIQTASIN